MLRDRMTAREGMGMGLGVGDVHVWRETVRIAKYTGELDRIDLLLGLAREPDAILIVDGDGEA